MTMIFRHGFFHGDPHPANILVLAPERIGLVDFGLAGKLTDQDMSRLTRLFIDAANENIEVLPRRLADLGVRYPKEREDEFVSRAARVLLPLLRREPERDRPAPDHPRGVRADLLDELRLPTRFVLLDKAIATVGSVGADLYPDFNVFEVAKPYARALDVERFTPRRVSGARGGRAGSSPRRGRAAVPDPRDARAGARRRDRGRLRAQGARRVHAQARRGDRTGS